MGEIDDLVVVVYEILVAKLDSTTCSTEVICIALLSRRYFTLAVNSSMSC